MSTIPWECFRAQDLAQNGLCPASVDALWHQHWACDQSVCYHWLHNGDFCAYLCFNTLTWRRHLVFGPAGRQHLHVLFRCDSQAYAIFSYSQCRRNQLKQMPCSLLLRSAGEFKCPGALPQRRFSPSHLIAVRQGRHERPVISRYDTREQSNTGKWSSRTQPRAFC